MKHFNEDAPELAGVGAPAATSHDTAAGGDLLEKEPYVRPTLTELGLLRTLTQDIYF